MQGISLMLLALLVLVVWVGCSQDNSVLNDLTAQIDALQNEVQLLQANLESLGQLNLTIDTLNRQIGVLQDRIDGLDNLKARVGFLDRQVKVQADQDSLNELRAEIDLLNNQFKVLVLQASSNEITLGKDRAEMVLIPAGPFEMGDHFNEGTVWERPVHTVTLDQFYMDATEVTVGRFRKFVTQSGYAYPGNWKNVAQYSPTDDHPMIYVTWWDAMAYAVWAGKRLPTEAEWEYAARGGLVGKRYPWGDEIDKTKAHYDSWNDGKGTTEAVGSYAENGYGLYDMVGNVWEWCLDGFDGHYYSRSPEKNPLAGHASIEELIKGYKGIGTDRMLRGGAWYGGTGYLRVAARNHDRPRPWDSFGFRCVADVN